MDLKDLSKININDLKEIDFEDIKSRILGRPDLLINILLIGLTIFASLFFYTSHKKKSDELKEEVETLEEKLEVVNAHKKVKSQYNKFVEEFPESLNIDQLSNTISNIAVTHNVQILKFSPLKSVKNDYFTVEGIDVSIQTPDYFNIINFIQDIEESPYTIRLEELSGSMPASKNRGRQDRSAAKNKKKQGKLIKINLKLSNVALVKN